MLDLILIDGDAAKFNPLFGVAIVDVQDGTLRASGFAGIDGAKVCVEGDESSVNVPGCTYMTASFPIKGTGTLTIDTLGPDQVAQQTTDNGTAVLLLGAVFTAKFTVVVPAQQIQPSGSVPDATPSYTGMGQFQTSNSDFRGA